MRRRQGGGTAYPASACEGGTCTHLHARRKSTPAFCETTQGSMSLCRVSSHGQLQHISSESPQAEGDSDKFAKSLYVHRLCLEAAEP